MSSFDLFVIFGPLCALCVAMAVLAEIARLGGNR
jgi:hypothetical protein